jgi:hypothetical protein
MQTAQAFRTIVGLIVVNDWDIFDEVARKHPSEFPPSALATYREIGDELAKLMAEYDFTKSAAFQESVAGRSDRYAETKARFESTPVKRREHRDRLASALTDLLVSDSALSLVSPEEQRLLVRIRQSLSAVESGA